MAKKILYLHGFASSGASGTVTLLRHEFHKAGEDTTVVAPDIPVDPAEALPMLKSLVEKEQPTLIVGTSMGGAYAQQLRGWERVCVNPSFEASKLYSLLYVGKHKWLNPRKDGALTFSVTKEIVDHFRDMEAHQFDGLDEVDAIFCHGLFGDADELTAGSRPLFDQHYPGMSRTFAGGHRLDAELVKKVLLPFLRELGI